MRETKELQKKRLMKHTPRKLPRDVDQFIKDVCLEDHYYIFYDKKTHFAYCSYCEKEIDKRFLVDTYAVHSAKDYCPVCKKHITYKCLGRLRERHEDYYHRTYRPRGTQDCFQLRIMQKVEEFIMIRCFSIIKCCAVTQIGKAYQIESQLKYSELQRICNNGSETRNYVARSYWDYSKGEWSDVWNESKKTSFVDSGWNEGNKVFNIFAYTKNLEEEKQPFLKYAINECARRYSPYKMGYQDPKAKLLDLYAYWHPVCEYIEKMGLTHLNDNILVGQRAGLNLKGKRIEEILRVPKEYIQLVKKGNMSLWDISMLKDLIKAGVSKITLEDIEFWKSNGYRYHDMRKWGPAITAHDFIKFCVRTCPNRTTIYIDYLKAAVGMGYDMTARHILFPSNVIEAHDREYARKLEWEKQIAAQKGKRIAVRFEKENSKYSFSCNGLLIRMIDSYEELLREGAALSHCVGIYAENVGRGDTTILAIRKVDDPEKPFYTLEYKQKKIEQYHGFKNESESGGVKSPEVVEFVHIWKKEMIKRENTKKYSKKDKTAVMAIAI